jgi:hypothetical protein
MPNFFYQLRERNPVAEWLLLTAVLPLSGKASVLRVIAIWFTLQ